MSLDNANFIAELSPIDPPGTDPLNQGDDHIRTTKRAVQQSFPNVGSAVPQTGAQMAQMAIKNEANTFTLINSFQSPLRTFSGTAAAPSYSFTSNTNMGMFRLAADVLGFTVAGVLQFSASNFGFNTFKQNRAIDGSLAAPSYSFGTRQGTGLSVGSGGALNFSHDGSRLMAMSAGLIDNQVFTQFSASGLRMQNFSNFIRKSGATQIAGISYEDASGFTRWLVGQSTANNGERFTFQRRDSGGNVLDSPLEIINTDGHVRVLQLDMHRDPDTSNAVIFWKTAGLVQRHTLNFEATGGFNPNSLTFSAYNSSGAFIGNTIRLGPNGEVFMELLPTTNPGGTNRLWKSSGFVAIT